jgi:motility quorum-sensing regulator/GCU-specific mRNA interferase toxin
MTDPSGPTFDLATVKALVSTGYFVLTKSALSGLGELGFDQADAQSCILAMTASDFQKTMPSEAAPGRFQDVYKPVYCGQPLYVKIQIALDKHTNQVVVVISFKRK